MYRQGDVNFIINAEPDSFAQRFARKHGPSVCAFALRVKDANFAYNATRDCPNGAVWVDAHNRLSLNVHLLTKYSQLYLCKVYFN